VKREDEELARANAYKEQRRAESEQRERELQMRRDRERLELQKIVEATPHGTYVPIAYGLRLIKRNIYYQHRSDVSLRKYLQNLPEIEPHKERNRWMINKTVMDAVIARASRLCPL
jgi:hypothetical protein